MMEMRSWRWSVQTNLFLLLQYENFKHTTTKFLLIWYTKSDFLHSSAEASSEQTIIFTAPMPYSYMPQLAKCPLRY